MSTCWGYYCEDCDKATGHNHNHGDDVLTEMALIFPKVKAILDDPGRPWCLDVRFDPVSGGYDEMQFLNDHFGHRIGVESEYGERIPIGTPPRPPA